MPSKEEMAALLEQLKTQEAASLKAKETQPVAPIASAAAATPHPFSVNDMNASNVMKARELDSSKGLQAADDAVRQVAGPVGDALAGMMSGNGTLLEALKSQEAAARLNANVPGSADVLVTAGDVGKIAAVPGAAFATPLWAMGTSGAIGAADTFFSRLEKGEPVNTNAEEYLNNAMHDAGTGLLGYHAGKLVGNTLGRFIKEDPALTKQAEEALAKTKAIADDATGKLRSSGISINTMGQNKLLRNVEKDIGKKYSLSPKTTPEAWKAMNILRDRVNKGADIALDAFHDLRTSIGKSLYSESGLLKRGVNSTDLAIVDDIYKSLTKFGNELPITRQFVRGNQKNNLKTAMDGWNSMTKFQQTQQRTEKLTELITNAEAATKYGSKQKALDQALQDEFASMFKTKAGREYAQRTFTPEQLKVLKKIAAGDVSQAVFATLDKWIGGFPIAPVLRMVRSGTNAAFQSEESRYAARKAISAVSEQPLKQRTGPKWGVATVVESMKNR